MKQFNVKMPENFALKAQEYAKEHGYRNLQELMLESLREKIFDQRSISSEQLGELLTHHREHSGSRKFDDKPKHFRVKM